MTAENMRGTTKTIRNTVLVCSNGLMEENTSEIGKMGNNMEEDNTSRQKDKEKLENGSTVKGLNGQKILQLFLLDNDQYFLI